MEGQRPIVERLLLAAYSIGQCYIAASNGCGSIWRAIPNGMHQLLRFLVVYIGVLGLTSQKKNDQAFLALGDLAESC